MECLCWGYNIEFNCYQIGIVVVLSIFGQVFCVVCGIISYIDLFVMFLLLLGVYNLFCDYLLGQDLFVVDYYCDYVVSVDIMCIVYLGEGFKVSFLLCGVDCYYGLVSDGDDCLFDVE